MFRNITFLFALLLSTTTFSQVTRTIDPQNCREGETVEYCRQHTHNNELLKDPAYRKQFEKDQAQLKAEEATFVSKGKGDIPNKGVIYRIPVVFHVLHNGGVENISRAQIMDALFILNRDYARQNADADFVYTPFQGEPTNVEIEFVLATKAPNGACFSGITRTKNPITSDGSSGTNQVNAIIAGNDVFNGQWPGNKYLNIFVCQDIGGAAGYTYLPGAQGTNMRNGIWVLQSYVGSIGTGNVSRSRTLTHEVGHWLNLPHVWGGTNNPGLASNCSLSSDDGVADTPQTIGNTSCNYFANTCSLDNAYWGFDKVDNVENYMDYSYCSKMFTAGQALRMRTAANSSVGGRNNVISASNIIAVGADSNFVLCKADFISTKRDICVGGTVTFTDDSHNGVQSWNWSFPGGTPSTSTAQNPTVTYSTPGTYSVTLTSSDGASSLTETKTGYVVVVPAGVPLPYAEGFEGYSDITNPNSFWRPRSTAGNQFELYTGTGSEGNKCVRLRNYGQPAGDEDDLESNSFDLSNLGTSDTVTFSFKYAHRKRAASDYEQLRFQVSNNCGVSWATRKTITGSVLSNAVVTTEWTPTPADFVQVHVTGINNSYFGPTLQTRFSFISGGGNNLYIDQINFYVGQPVGIDELNIVQDLVLYPNPTEGDINLKFFANQSADVVLFVQDLTGKVLKRHIVKASTGENLVITDTNDLSAGIYFLKVQSGNSYQTLQFVVK